MNFGVCNDYEYTYKLCKKYWCEVKNYKTLHTSWHFRRYVGPM